MNITWTNDTRKLSDLVPWEHNPKRMTRKQADGLRLSIERFGFAVPFLVSPDGDIYDGHQRQALMNAIQEYGPDAVVDVRVSSRPLTDDERRELVVRLKQNQAGWDFKMLPNLYEREELLEWGFEPEELGMFPDEPAGDDPGPQVDRAAELREKWGVKTGDLWALGEHRLICGDCTDRAVVQRVMGGERAGCCVTDPPYGINREGITNDDPEGLRALFDGCLAAMPITDGVLIAFQSPRLEWVWLDATRAAGWHPERLLWMYKPNDETFPWRGWLLTSEAIRASSKGKSEWLDVHPYSHDCYSPTTLGQELSDTEGWHASVKPQAVVIDLVKRVGGIVYEPFLGSGTTLIACERLGRRCRACEIEPGYVGVALERFYQMTGIQPVLLEAA